MRIPKKILDTFLNCLFIWFLTWKLSYILIEPNLVLKNPLSILYYTGGAIGIIIATFVSFIYLVVKIDKNQALVTNLYRYYPVMWIQSWTGYFLLDAIFHDKNVEEAILFIFLFLLFTWWQWKVHSFRTFMLISFAMSLIVPFKIDQLFIAYLLLFIGLFPRFMFTVKKAELKRRLAFIVLLSLISWMLYNQFEVYQLNKEMKMNVEKQQNNSEKTIGITQENVAPNFMLQNLSDESIHLFDYRGKKVILNFWATWCPPCKAEMPHMQEFYHEQQNNNVVILSVNLTNQEKNIDAVHSFIKDYKLTFPVLVDEEGKVGHMYQVKTIPTTYIINTKGVISHKITGVISKEMMNKLVKEIE